MRLSTAITLIAFPVGYWISTLLWGASVEMALIITITTWFVVGMLRFNEWLEKGNDE